jgi:hypothetical protein
MLPPGESFNASWFIDQHLVPLVQSFFPAGAQSKTIDGHVDNAPAHNARMTQNFFEHNPLKRLLHLPYAPEMSPSDFGRLGKSSER